MQSAAKQTIVLIVNVLKNNGHHPYHSTSRMDITWSVGYMKIHLTAEAAKAELATAEFVTHNTTHPA